MNTLPYNDQAERALIGSVLLYAPAYFEISKHVGLNDFYIVKNQLVWGAIEKLTKSHNNVDLITISTELESAGKLDEIGGANYIVGIVSETPSAMNAESYAKMVADCAMRRRMITLATDMAKNAYNQEENIDEYVPVFISELLKSISTENSTIHISAALSDLYDDIQKRSENPQEIYGITTGIGGIDAITGGLQAGELFLLSGEPGLGKSLLAIQMAFSMGKHNVPGVIYEMEMSMKQTLRRTLSVESGIRARQMKTGMVNEGEMYSINDAIQRLETLPIYVSESTSWTTAKLRSDLTRMKQLYGVQWFVVDYLRLLKDRFDGKEPERIGMVTSALHDICKDLNIAGLAIQSMTKEGMREGGMTGVYGGSELQHACDVMATLKKRGQNTIDNNEIIDLIFEKLREGDDDRRVVPMVKKPGFPQFAELLSTPVRR